MSSSGNRDGHAVIARDEGTFVSGGMPPSSRLSADAGANVQVLLN